MRAAGLSISASMTFIRRVIVCAPLVVLAAALAPGAATASATYDLQGLWGVTAATGGGYAQLFTISKMDMATGAFSGTGDGTVFVLKGVETGAKVKYTQTEGGYTAYDSATVVIKNGKLAFINGKWHDSNGSGGVFAAVIIKPAAAGPAPVLAKSVVAGTVSGRVLIERAGATTFTPLGSSSSIPVGSTVDATDGKVRLTSAGIGGHLYTGTFHSGEFVVSESHDGLTNLTLAGGVACAASAAAAKGSTSTHAPAAKRSLWGYAHGNFKTTGHYGAATVLGTQWLTRDECTGTLVRVLTGEVRVSDLVRHRSVIVRAPRSYFVKA